MSTNINDTIGLLGQVSTCTGRNQLPIFRCTEVQLRRHTRPLLDDVMSQNEITISIFHRPYVTMISIAVLKTDLKPVLLHFVSTFLNLIVQPNEVISNLFLSEMLFWRRKSSFDKFSNECFFNLNTFNFVGNNCNGKYVRYVRWLFVCNFVLC